MNERREHELVLAPNEYAYVLDTTKGLINCYVGPNKTSLAQTDQPVVFDPTSKRFTHVDLTDAVSLFITAPANWYVVLKNPAGDNQHPRPGVANSLTDLQVGRKINAPGPASFPLWPGQLAKVICGHRLRSNEYLIVRVYDAEQANSAADRADKSATDSDTVAGQLRVIKGTDLRFYMPVSGVEVVPDEEGRHVREAVTLNRLQYCTLIGEDGRKHFIRGEKVVFPEPNQRFMERDGRRAFQAIELSDTTGLHVKVIAPYTEEDGVARRAGEELFITGEGVIYFPREEHIIVGEPGAEVHEAEAIPKGEGRYLLNRRSGEMELVRGPAMLLPDPRAQVITRRVLSDRECQLLFPDNPAALAWNRALRGARESQDRLNQRMLKLANQGGGRRRSRDSAGKRVRSITLNERFSGAVRLDLWSGYAVQVVDKAGNRRVEQGPRSILLDYDEMLQPLSLSTGCPKTDEQLLDTVFLQVTGNKVSDQLSLLTRDLVQARLSLTYRVSFEGTEPHRWFAVDNYVKLLCDHASSMIKARLRRETIRTLQSDIASIVRDMLLGPKNEDGQPGGSPRAGRLFKENSMRVYDVEVLELEVLDEDVRELLVGAQTEAMERAIDLSAQETELARELRMQEIERSLDQERHRTQLLRRSLEAERLQLAHAAAELERQRQAQLAEMAGALAQQQAALDVQLLRTRLTGREAQQQVDLTQRKELQALKLEELNAQVQGAVTTVGAIDANLAQAMHRLGDQQLLESLADNFGELAAVEGRGLLATAQKFLDFVPSTLVPTLQLGDAAQALGPRETPEAK